MAIRKIVSRSISDNAITSTDLATAVTTNPVFSGTDSLIAPKGTTAQRSGSPVEGMLRYNTTTGLYEQYTAVGWQAIDAPPTISSISPTTYSGEQGTTITITGTNFKSGAVVKFVTNSGAESNAGTTTFVSSTSLTATTSQDYTVADEPLDVKVVNPSGLSGVLENALDCGATPTWSTSAGSLATIYDSGRASYTTSPGISVTATDPDSGSTISYSVVSGALPTGLSLNSSTGAITGSVTNGVGSDTTSSFTIRATDNAGNTNDRAFSITVKAPVVTSFTTTGSSTWTVPTGISSVQVLVVAGGGAGGGSDSNSAGGGGAGGMIEHPSFPVTPGGTVSYSVGAGAPTVVNSGGGAGSNSTFGTLTALGGGGGGAQNYPQTRGQPGGSGGGSSWEPPGNGTAQGMGIQTSSPAISADSRTYGYGYPGGIQVYDGGSAAATGGGGAGGAAGQINPGSQPHQASAGGPGRASTITGSPVYYAGGGGASGYYTQTNGGVGGGGNSVNNTNRNGSTNTGGGGGGCAIGGNNVGNTGGAGGPGIVIIRY